MYEVRNSLVGHSLPVRYLSHDHAVAAARVANANNSNGGYYTVQPVYWPN